MKIGIVLFVLALIMPVHAYGTVDYSRQTAKACKACHINPAGGGELTAEGKAFKDELRIKGLYRPLTTTQHVVRFIIGYLHMMTAIVWFGAILYVHLLLKPAYAARGLPKGELILGWVSIVIMAVTGTLLTIARIPSRQMLFHTRFGVLLMIKIALFLVMVATAAVVTFVIGPKLRRRRQTKIEQQKQNLTLEELRQFDGKEGRPAYIAYDGKIYDVTGSKLWRGGSHARKHLAGFDLTDALRKAPHGEEKITSMPPVGRLVPSGKREMPTHEKVFYFFAYMNLVLIFLIVFVISLWRWW